MPYFALLLSTALLGQGHAKLEYHQRLDHAVHMPVAVSPDGKKLLYFTRKTTATDMELDSEEAECVYTLADIDGANQRILFESPVEEMFLNSLVTDRSFSADGKEIVVATTDNGQSLTNQQDGGQLLPLVISQDGKNQRIKCELGSCGGFGFLKQGLLVLDTPGLLGGVGYRLSLHKDGEVQRIQSDDKVAASCLRISPDGAKAAFFISSHVASGVVRLRCVDLSSGKAIDSPEFRSHSATFAGRPQLFWDDTSEGVYCHVSTHPQSSWPNEATHYNFDQQAGSVIPARRESHLSCTLGDGLVGFWDLDGDTSSVWDSKTKTFYQLPEGNYVLGGRGDRMVVADDERQAVYATSVKLTAERRSSPPDDR